MILNIIRRTANRTVLIIIVIFAGFHLLSSAAHAAEVWVPPEKVWVPPHWVESNYGRELVDGHWKKVRDGHWRHIDDLDNEDYE